jgi:hypothetical protein
MANYYVRPDGSNSNAGTGQATNQAWQTITYALTNMILTNGVNYLYVAPGVYRESPSVTITPSSTQTLVIQGDPSCSVFTGLNQDIVFITNFANDNTEPTLGNVFTCSKPYVTLKNLQICGFGYTQFSNANNITLENCVFATSRIISNNPRGTVRLTTSSNNPLNATITKCNFYGDTGLFIEGQTTGSTYNFNTVVSDCLFIVASGLLVDGLSYNTGTAGNGVSLYNSVFIFSDLGFSVRSTNTSNTSYAYNNVFYQTISGGAATALTANVTGRLVEDYNRIASSVTRSNVATGTNSRAGLTGLDLNATQITSSIATPFFSPYRNSPLIGAGTSSGAPVTDQYGFAWTSGTDIGAFSRTLLSSTSFYFPTERNASTITIAPGSTSQSIELYLGATGLTASTSGLSAYYNRTRTADVQIPLVARVIDGSNPSGVWTAGGFAEVNASTMPGVYRLDIPNEALASGVDDVTIVVRGASGTNGAVMSIKLSSGGLTSTQTAQAVWNALTSSHTTHGTFGWNSLRADAPSKEGLVTLHQSGGVSRIDADVHAVQNDTAAATTLKGALLHDGTGYVDADVVRISTSTAAANELEGALLHNGTDYIDSNLLSGNSTRVYVGRFDLRQTGSDDVDTIEVFTTDTPSFELQLTDGDGNEVPVTGTTLGLRILDVASTVVETGTPTVEYGTGGIVRWTGPGTYLAIGCPVGMYRLFIDRTVSGTTTTFGPLQIKVQAQ